MEDAFSIYVDRLEGGEKLPIYEELSSEFMDIHEAELAFESPIRVEGEAYLGGEALIIHLKSVTGRAVMPCCICNSNTTVPIALHDIYFTEETAKIRGGIFSFKELLREAILLEVPLTAECHQGSCPQRESMAQYFSKKKKEDNEAQSYHPFADLE